MTKLVAQSVINSFFDGKHADPFAVLGMHETHNGIEIRALLPDADKVEVIDKEKISEADNRLVPIIRFFMLPGYVLALFPPDDVSCLEW